MTNDWFNTYIITEFIFLLDMSALSAQQQQTEDPLPHPPSNLNILNPLNSTANNFSSQNSTTSNVQNGNFLVQNILATNAKRNTSRGGSPPSPSSSEENKALVNGPNSNANGVVALVNKNLSGQAKCTCLGMSPNECIRNMQVSSKN